MRSFSGVEPKNDGPSLQHPSPDSNMASLARYLCEISGGLGDVVYIEISSLSNPYHPRGGGDRVFHMPSVSKGKSSYKLKKTTLFQMFFPVDLHRIPKATYLYFCADLWASVLTHLSCCTNSYNTSLASSSLNFALKSFL